MVDFALGIAIGAAFAPFWMMVWGKIKAYAVSIKVSTTTK